MSDENTTPPDEHAPSIADSSTEPFWRRLSESAIRLFGSRGGLIVFGTLSVVACYLAVWIVTDLEHDPFVLFRRVLALAGAVLIIVYINRTRDVALRSLGLVFIAALIVTPNDIIRIVAAVQDKQYIFSEQSPEYDVVRALTNDHEGLARRAITELDAYAGLSSELSVYRADDPDFRVNLMACALEEATEAFVLNRIQYRDEFTLLAAMYDAREEGDDWLIASRFDEDDGNTVELERDLELLRALGLVKFDRRQYREAVLTEEGVERVSDARNPRAASLSDPLREAVQNPNLRREDFSDEEFAAAFTDSPHCQEVVGTIVQLLRDRADRPDIEDGADTRTIYRSDSARSGFGEIPYADDAVVELFETPQPGSDGRVVFQPNVSLREDTTWFFVDREELDDVERPYFYRIEAWQAGGDPGAVDPKLIVLDTWGSRLTENDDGYVLATDEERSNRHSRDARAYFVVAPGEFGFWVGVQAFSANTTGPANLAIYRFEPAGPPNGSAALQ